MSRRDGIVKKTMWRAEGDCATWNFLDRPTAMLKENLKRKRENEGATLVALLRVKRRAAHLKTASLVSDLDPDFVNLLICRPTSKDIGVRGNLNIRQICGERERNHVRLL